MIEILVVIAIIGILAGVFVFWILGNEELKNIVKISMSRLRKTRAILPAPEDIGTTI